MRYIILYSPHNDMDLIRVVFYIMQRGWTNVEWLLSHLILFFFLCVDKMDYKQRNVPFQSVNSKWGLSHLYVTYKNNAQQFQREAEKTNLVGPELMEYSKLLHPWGWIDWTWRINPQITRAEMHDFFDLKVGSRVAFFGLKLHPRVICGRIRCFTFDFNH